MVSIIIPVYNASVYLDVCLESVFKQSFQDWECILVDDGSTDGSGDICRAWSMRDSRFIAVSQQNGGVSVARNRALTMVRGEWVAFVDADDWLDENYLYEMMAVGKKDCDLIVSGQIRECGKEQIVYKPDESECWVLDSNHAGRFNELNEKFLLYAPHEKLFKAEIIKENNLCFDPGCSYGEDLQFVYAYLEYVRAIGTVDKAMYHYRMGNGESLSTKFRADQFSVDYRQWRIVNDYYRNHNLLSDRASRYLYRRLWGIVYDGLFLAPRMAKVSWSYIYSIMSIPEIRGMRQYKEVFACSAWIKYAIMYRLVGVMWCYFKLQETKK